MNKIIDSSLCCGCGACVYICPRQCIEMEIDVEGFSIPKVDSESCIDCGKCIKKCPIINNNYLGQQYSSICYAAINNSEEERKKSSSGGIFILLADRMIKNNGYVCGAIVDKNRNVKHVLSNNIEEIKQMRGSKYLQSDLSGIFASIETVISRNQKILFTGTPCQCAAIKSVFGDDNIEYLDVVCKGVPSNLVFSKYMDYLERKYNKNIKSVYFRDKSTGWKKYSLKIVFVDETCTLIEHHESLFYKLFINDVISRKSCYQCKYRERRASDITLGDLWGMKEICTMDDDDLGCNAVLLNTKRGEKIWNEIKDRCNYENIELVNIVKNNESIIESPLPHPKRKAFYNMIKIKEFENISDEIIRLNWIEKVIWHLRGCLIKYKRKEQKGKKNDSN